MSGVSKTPIYDKLQREPWRLLPYRSAADESASCSGSHIGALEIDRVAARVGDVAPHWECAECGGISNAPYVLHSALKKALPAPVELPPLPRIEKEPE